MTSWLELMIQSWPEQPNGDSLENSKYRPDSQKFAFIRLCSPIQFLQRVAALDASQLK